MVRYEKTILAEGQGFEPWDGVTVAGFQDQCFRPLSHPSGRRHANKARSRGIAWAVEISRDRIRWDGAVANAKRLHTCAGDRARHAIRARF